jgi:hypothetical protein
MFDPRGWCARYCIIGSDARSGVLTLQVEQFGGGIFLHFEAAIGHWVSATGNCKDAA